MKALEFQATLDSGNSLKVPPDIAAQIRGDVSVRVIVVVGGSDDDDSWSQMTLEQFLAGYDPGDAIYDELPTG